LGYVAVLQQQDPAGLLTSLAGNRLVLVEPCVLQVDTATLLPEM